ncbi:MAG TPA: phage holin family protein [Stellaceae bacterium]|nr:phage holin family protein [Stellaceae bacterium]
MLSESRPRSEPGTPRPQSTRPVAALLSDFASETGQLVQQELALFKAEMREKLGRFGQGAGALAAGGLIAFSGWLALLAAAILGLNYVVAPWLAALIVGLVVVAVGAGLLFYGKSRLGADALVPRRTLNSLREDEAWIRDQLS